MSADTPSAAHGPLPESDPSEGPLLRALGLEIDRPDGSPLLRAVDLELRSAQIVALLGGSGAGKSTLVTALHDEARLTGAGFTVRHLSLERRAEVGLVPQRGALFDHLDVAGNLALALRNAAPPQTVDADALQDMLASVDLPRSWAGGEARAVGRLSGGEAQRLAVARTLAARRRILFLDEPSVGLDPLRVHDLADLLRAEIRRRQATALVITHELEFAAGFADRFLLLDGGQLVELTLPAELAAGLAAGPASGPGAGLASGLGAASSSRPAGSRRPVELRRRIAAALAEQMAARLTTSVATPNPSASGAGRRLLAGARRVASTALGGLEVAPRVLAQLGRALTRPRDFIEVLTPVLKQALLRPAGFFTVVSLLLGFTLLYILHRSIAGGELPIRPERVFSLIGSMHVIALAPALAAILFSATSANAVVAWLGGMSLTRQTTALRGLGIAETRYLWVPAWLGLVVAQLVLAALFVLGMLLGGAAYLELAVPELGVGSWELITADLLDPPPQRAVFRRRAIGLLLVYAVGIAGDAVAKGSRDKHSAEEVTVAMVRSVMVATSWIVALELASLVLVYAG